MVKKIFIACVSAFACLATASAQKDTLEISTLYTTYIRFPIEVLTAERSDSENVIGEIVQESKNLVRLRATRPFTRTSNVTVIDSKGFLHTYYIKYTEHPKQTYYDKSGAAEEPSYQNRQAQDAPAEYSAPPADGRGGGQGRNPGTKVSNLRMDDAPSLQDIINYEQNVFHLSTRKGRIILTCENIFTYSDMLYIILRIDNRSGVSYESDGATFTRATMSRKSKIPLSTNNLYPKNRFGSLTVPPGQSGRLAYSLDKLTLAADQVLQISVPERNGSREFNLTLTAEDVNLAPTPFKR